MGGELARLPLDPRVGRMILEARQRGALHEVLVIASALSLQDVRDRPLELQAQADQQHAKFDDEKSEFSGYLRLWQWLEESRGGHTRDDFPGPDDRWGALNLVLTLPPGSDEVDLRHQPLPAMPEDLKELFD